MSIHVALNHVTGYRYERSVRLGPQIVRLRPTAHSRTIRLAYPLKIDPATHFINLQQDAHAKRSARLTFPEKTEMLRIEMGLDVGMAVMDPFDVFLEPDARQFPFTCEAGERHDLAPYLTSRLRGHRFEQYVTELPGGQRNTVEFLAEVNRRLSRDVRCLVRLEPGVRTPEETLECGSDSCRDPGWLLVQMLRQAGLAARFVSGYLIELKADVPSLDGPSGRSYGTFPVNAFESEGRRRARLLRMGHTAGVVAAPPSFEDPDFPFTLDLRQARLL